MICKICLGQLDGHPQHEGYHNACLKRLFGSSNVVPSLDFDKSKFEVEIVQKYSKRMSISGVQQKLSVRLEGTKIVPTDVGGTYLLKPAPSKYPEICQNEHVSMKIGALLGIDTPPCGLISFSDGELAYIVKRFDREGDKKIHQEDMAQVLKKSKDEEENYKYSGDYESVAKAILEATGKPATVLRFFERLVFNYLIANGDFHLKNISLQDPDHAGMYGQLTPLYDSVNTRIHLPEESRDLALEELFADGSDTEKFNQYGYHTGFDFKEFGRRIGIGEKAAEQFLDKVKGKKAEMLTLVDASYLSTSMKEKYRAELMGRYARLFERP